jgi:hypothetical protein
VRHLGLELLQQVPGDGLALAVFIGGEQEFVGVLEQALELGDLLPLVAVHDVQGLEVVVHVDAERAHGSPLYLAGISAALSGMSRMWPTLDSTT